MNENKTGFEGLSFNPNLETPADEPETPKEQAKKNIRKTSVNFQEDVRKNLYTYKEKACINVSDYINKAVANRLELDMAKEKSAFRYDGKDYVRTEIYLHKDMALFLKELELINGAVKLADKLAEVFAYQLTAYIMKGDLHMYGVGKDDFDKLVAKFKQARERLNR